ncbi:MAG: hypothetical protein DCC71_13685 [Proteobacteria bacterium]|nr:MAG: hypothetical protein DCC71_13685 [Pseudomonadota bacterium]
MARALATSTAARSIAERSATIAQRVLVSPSSSELIAMRTGHDAPSPLRSRTSHSPLPALCSASKLARASGRTKSASARCASASGRSPTSSPKRRFAYRIAPSSASTSAPSGIDSTSSRYGRSAPCSV